MNISKNDILQGGMVLGFIGTIAYAIDAHLKLKKAAEKMEIAAKDLYEETSINISDELVQRTVERAAKDEARYQVSKAMDKAAKDITNDFKTQIENVVEDEFKLQKADVAKSLKRKIDDIDIQGLRREVKAEAKEALVSKLKDDIDDLSDKYTEQIEAMTNIYETVATKIEGIGD